MKSKRTISRFNHFWSLVNCTDARKIATCCEQLSKMSWKTSYSRQSFQRYLHAHTNTYLSVYITECQASNRHKIEEKQELHGRKTSADKQTRLLYPVLVVRITSLLEKKFQWTPNIQAVFSLQRDFCLNPPQVTRSILTNLDISMEPFHQIFFHVQIISWNLFEIQRKHFIDNV